MEKSNNNFENIEFEDSETQINNSKNIEISTSNENEGSTKETTSTIIDYKLGNYLKYIKYPVITEKSVKAYENKKYTFIVDKKLSKPLLKEIFKTIFNVEVVKISILMLPKKTKKVKRYIGTKTIYKKALITFKNEGNSMLDNFFS